MTEPREETDLERRLRAALKARVDLEPSLGGETESSPPLGERALADRASSPGRLGTG